MKSRESQGQTAQAHPKTRSQEPRVCTWMCTWGLQTIPSPASASFPSERNQREHKPHNPEHLRGFPRSRQCDSAAGL